jgi:3-deoxy-D-manno-octulosonic-acid transferase
MIKILYNIIIHMLFIILIPYFIFKMITAGKYRIGISERMGSFNDAKLASLKNNTKKIWFHAVSVGETKAALPLLRLLKEKHPEIKIIFSTVTPTGQAIAKGEGKDKGLIDTLIYFPFDFSWTVNKVIRLIKPAAFVAVEKEIWPNHMRSLQKANIPAIIVNGTFSKKSFGGYKRFSIVFSDMFKAISSFCARTAEDAEMARELGISRAAVTLTGNLKFDMKIDINEQGITELLDSLGLKTSDHVIVAGSTHEGEESIILETFKELLKELPSLKLVIGPRHPERFNEVEKIIKDSRLPYSRRSQGKANNDTRVILLDTMGELSKVYALSTVAFVGGTLKDIGGHNLLEPAFFGKPVVYGPYLKSYEYMADMLEEAGASLRVDKNTLLQELKRLLTNEVLCKKMGKRALEVTEKNTGATNKTFKIIDKYLKETYLSKANPNEANLAPSEDSKDPSGKD